MFYLLIYLLLLIFTSGIAMSQIHNSHLLDYYAAIISGGLTTHDTLHLPVQISDDDNSDDVLPVRGNGRREDRVGVDKVFKITKFEQNDRQLVTSECICNLYTTRHAISDF